MVNINLLNTDFDGIRDSIKEALRNQTELNDYDFDGSALSTLIDVLAYNTFYEIVYQNLSINELFLDSATKRNSVVSLAKTLGYTPRSATCASVRVNIENNTSNNITVNGKTDAFIGSIGEENYNFYAWNEMLRFGDSEIKENVLLREGTPVNQIIPYTGEDTRFLIPNGNIDIDTLIVRVFDTATASNSTPFNRNENILNILDEPNVYFIKENDDGVYEIEFGNGDIGTALVNGNVVHMDYLVSSLEASNGIRTGNITRENLTIMSSGTGNEIVSGGSGKENLNSIKHNAPRYYASQNRAVTTEDYKTLISNEIPNIGYIGVWGGEENDPPEYGKVFISIRKTDGMSITSSEKTNITNVVNKKRIITINPEIIEPDIFNINLNINIVYKPTATIRTESEIKELIKTFVISYNNELLMNGSNFRISVFSSGINNMEGSIESNITAISLQKVLTFVPDSSNDYVVNFANPIKKINGGTTYASFDNKTIKDDGNGNLELFNTVNNETTPVGTIDYAKGVLNILNGVITENVTFTVIPDKNDIIPLRNNVFNINTPNDADITFETI